MLNRSCRPGNFLVLFFSFIIFLPAVGSQRENLALRHPCYAVNKRLEPYITWTEKLASSQYKGPKDACGHFGASPVCCTHDIVNSYAISLGIELKLMVDVELNRLTMLFLSSKQQIDDWLKEYIAESRRLTTISLETLLGAREYRAHVHQVASALFDTLSNTQSSGDDVSRSAVTLFSQLVVSSYRRFMTYDERVPLDEKFQKCLVNRALDIEAFPSQRELLYTLTSGSSLIQTLRTMLIYMDADIQRLKTIATITSNACTQRYARETLCPICVTPSSAVDPISQAAGVNESLCPKACRQVIRTCFNQTSNPYVAFASIAKGYSIVAKDIERAILQLKLVERLSKLHIYFYDMVVNASNTRHTYTELQTACPHANGKPFTPIVSLPPITSERRELVSNWNRSLQFILSQLQSSIDNLNLRLTQQISTDICSNVNYASKSSRCTQIDKRTTSHFNQWPLPSLSETPSPANLNDVELTRNQLAELKKKMTPIQQIILSLQPKEKYPLIGYLPDFESYDNEPQDNEENNLPSSPLIDMDNSDLQGSLSERLYKEIEGQTTRRRVILTTPDAYHRVKSINQSSLLSQCCALNLPVLLLVLLHRISLRD